MTTTVINSETTSDILNSIVLGDTITNEQGTTGSVIAINKGVNAGVMQYDFSLDNGVDKFSHYSFNNRPI